MEKKEKIINGKVEFYKLESGRAGGVKEFRDKLEEIHGFFERKNWDAIPNLKINDDVYYINAMQRRTIGDKFNNENMYYWLVTLSKVKFDQNIILADIRKKVNERRREVEHEENEGLVVDSRFIFDPFRNVLAIYNKRGTVNRYELRKFICELVSVKGIQFEIILNEDGYKRVNQLNIIDKVTYKVASPDNFSKYKDENRSEFGDLKFAKSVHGSELKVEVKSSQLTKKNLVEKAKNVFSAEDLDVKSFMIDGFSDGKPETIDLVKNKLNYYGNIVIRDYIDDNAAYGLLNKAFDTHYIYLKKTFGIVK